MSRPHGLIPLFLIGLLAFSATSDSAGYASELELRQKSDAGGAHCVITGQIAWGGKPIPHVAPVKDAFDRAIPFEFLLVDPKSLGIKNVYVFVEPVVPVAKPTPSW